jgi:hypothetical protein
VPGARPAGLTVSQPGAGRGCGCRKGGGYYAGYGASLDRRRGGWRAGDLLGCESQGGGRGNEGRGDRKGDGNRERLIHRDGSVVNPDCEVGGKRIDRDADGRRNCFRDSTEIEPGAARRGSEGKVECGRRLCAGKGEGLRPRKSAARGERDAKGCGRCCDNRSGLGMRQMRDQQRDQGEKVERAHGRVDTISLMGLA